MDQELQALRNEVEVLKEDQKALEEEVRRLRRAFAGLRAPDRQGGYPESEGSYSFIEGAAARSSIAPSSPARSVDSVGTRSFAASGVSTVAPAATGLPQSWARREEIADGIGLWVRRALSGQNRGIKIHCRAAFGLSFAPSRVRTLIPHWCIAAGLEQRPW